MPVPDIPDRLDGLSAAVAEVQAALQNLVPLALGSYIPGASIDDLNHGGTKPINLAITTLLRPAIDQFDSFDLAVAGVLTGTDVTGAPIVDAVGNRASLVAIRGSFERTVHAPFPPPSPTESPRVTHARDLIVGTAERFTEAIVELRLFQTPDTAQAVAAGQITDRVSDIAAYPVLTSDVPPLRVDGFGGGGGDDPVAIVDSAIRDVIGRLPRHTDTRSFMIALHNSFGVTEDGQRTVVWRPRGQGAQAQLGGGVTGAQASLFARVKDAVEAIEPLLDGLVPLAPNPDVQEMDAARSVLRTELLEVLDELAIEGGPRRSRVDQLIEALLLDDVEGAAGPIGKGMLGYLGNVFGFADALGRPTDHLVATIEEEHQYSSYILLTDYLRGIESSWTAFKANYPEFDFGTRLILLSRAFQVVAESVDQVEAALDSVFVGEAERGVTTFRDSTGSPMLVAEVLSWTRRFSVEEGPTLVTEGGRRGLGPIVGSSDRLVGHVDALLRAAVSDPTLPAGLRHPRVGNPLQELVAYLKRVSALAGSVRVPQP